MSQTSASEPPIMATTVEVLDNQNQTTSPYNEREGGYVQRRTRRVLSTSSISSDSSLLWTPQVVSEHVKRSNSRNHRKKHGRRLWKEGEQQNTTDETSPFLSTPGQHLPKDLCSFERDHQENRTRHHSRNSPRSSSRRSHKHKQHRELYNDYTRYQYHRRSHRGKHKKHENSNGTNDNHKSGKSGLTRIIQRIKDFFFGKKDEKEKYQIKEHLMLDEPSRHHHKHISGKLFRSASDSDIEVVKHHRRHKKHTRRAKDDLYKHGKHWKAKRNSNKLSSIYESSDTKTGGLASSSDGGRLVVARSGSTTYNDIKYKPIRHERSKHREETGTSEGSHSQQEFPRKGRHGRRSKDYRRLKKKWAKQHQSFENDLEKLEKLVELVNSKKNTDRLEQKAIEDTTLLERLEAKQEKCVAEVDFTRHVLVCKLQRLENKLENRLTAMDSNNNTTEEREKGIEEIREEMSKECRDLRKLLQETSEQLKQVLEEKQIIPDQKMVEYNDLSQLENVDGQQALDHSDIPSLSCSTVPFPELSHHPLNQHRERLETSCHKEASKDKSIPTRVSTYV